MHIDLNGKKLLVLTSKKITVKPASTTILPWMKRWNGKLYKWKPAP